MWPDSRRDSRSRYAAARAAWLAEYVLRGRSRRVEAVGFISEIIARHGYAVVAIAIGLESMGIPMPGETMLVSAAIYAGTTHEMNIVFLIAWATAGAIIGDNLGFIIGRRFGHRLLLQHGDRLGINASRIRLG